MADKERVLILCTGNSARSQMAEGLLRHDAGARFEVSSAGTQPGYVRSEAIAVMKELGIDISQHRSKSVDVFTGQSFDYVLTVCDNANEKCPIYPANKMRLHHNFEDPASIEGTEDKRLAAFRDVRNQIRAYLRHFPESEISQMNKKRVLFVCTGNSARSQMAEGLLRNMAGDEFEVFSAGTAPKGIHPKSIQVMNEAGIDISGQRSKSIDEFLGQPFDYVITACDRARQNCPVMPGSTPFHWGFDDPAEAPEESQTESFRRVRDEIKLRLRLFLSANRK